MKLPYIPSTRSGRQRARHERFSVSLAANYVARMRTVAGQGAPTPRNRSILTRLGRHGPVEFQRQLSTYLKVDNLFDEVYRRARRPAGCGPAWTERLSRAQLRL